MSTIVPTITTDDPAVFNANITEFSQFAKRIQVDASDGTFAPTMMVPLSSMAFPEGVTIE